MLFRVGDVDSCVHCLDWAIHHPQELVAMATNAQKHVKDYYNWDDITIQTLEILQSTKRRRNSLVLNKPINA
jgi:hypothetical protein